MPGGATPNGRLLKGIPAAPFRKTKCYYQGVMPILIQFN